MRSRRSQGRSAGGRRRSGGGHRATTQSSRSVSPNQVRRCRRERVSGVATGRWLPRRSPPWTPRGPVRKTTIVAIADALRCPVGLSAGRSTRADRPRRTCPPPRPGGPIRASLCFGGGEAGQGDPRPARPTRDPPGGPADRRPDPPVGDRVDRKTTWPAAPPFSGPCSKRCRRLAPSLAVVAASGRSVACRTRVADPQTARACLQIRSRCRHRPFVHQGVRGHRRASTLDRDGVSKPTILYLGGRRRPLASEPASPVDAAPRGGGGRQCRTRAGHVSFPVGRPAPFPGEAPVDPARPGPPSKQALAARRCAADRLAGPTPGGGRRIDAG